MESKQNAAALLIETYWKEKTKIQIKRMIRNRTMRRCFRLSTAATSVMIWFIPILWVYILSVRHMDRARWTANAWSAWFGKSSRWTNHYEKWNCLPEQGWADWRSKSTRDEGLRRKHSLSARGIKTGCQKPLKARRIAYVQRTDDSWCSDWNYARCWH